VYNDLDADAVNVFRVLRDPTAAAELRRLLDLTPWARAEFEAAYELCADPIERARRMVVRTFMGHGTTSRRKNRTGFRSGSHPGRRGGGFGDWAGYAQAIDSFTQRLRGVVIEERPALELLDRHDADDALFYCDPPYPLSTRTAVRTASESDRCYAHDMVDDDHRNVAGVLHTRRAAVIVSGYACSLYDNELYAGWERHEFKVRGDAGCDRTEVIWIKPAGVVLAPPRTLTQGSLEFTPSARERGA
jgi:DNA adenine methylase